MATIVVTGGAGYIGSHTVRFLLDAGHTVRVIDNLSKGFMHNVPQGLLHQLDLSDTAALVPALKGADAVVHFAAFISVGESTQRPELYFSNNTGATLSLLTAMVESEVSRLVFSSTAAVYGDPVIVPIPETHPIAPVNPYGESKVLVERILDWMDRQRGLRSVRLRYFNACGCEPSFGIGEEHVPESHLIPLMFRAVHSGQPLKLFGDDYPTPDGTCIRDYIDVVDLAAAHLAALDYLLRGGKTEAFNCGTGNGSSVLEVLRAVEEATGAKVPYETAPRREGDPAELVADASKIQSILGWRARKSLRDSIRDAWHFEQRRVAASAGQ